jgi:hypothetical protein
MAPRDCRGAGLAGSLTTPLAPWVDQPSRGVVVTRVGATYSSHLRRPAHTWRCLPQGAGRAVAGVVGVLGRDEVAGRVLVHGWSRHLGVCQRIQYGRTAMRMQRQQSATRVFLVFAIALVSLWAGGLASSAVGNSADQLAASRSLPGVEQAAPPDRVPALRPPGERPSPSGRLLPVLLGMLAAALAVACGPHARRLRSGPARPRSLVRGTARGARAPPPLQPA